MLSTQIPQALETPEFAAFQHEQGRAARGKLNIAVPHPRLRPPCFRKPRMRSQALRPFTMLKQVACCRGTDESFTPQWTYSCRSWHHPPTMRLYPKYRPWGQHPQSLADSSRTRAFKAVLFVECTSIESSYPQCSRRRNASPAA